MTSRASTSEGRVAIYPTSAFRPVGFTIGIQASGGVTRRDVRHQGIDRHDLERALVGGAEHDGCGDARTVGLEPARGANAPAVAGLETGEAPLGTRRREVVAGKLAEVEELLGHHGAHRVASEVLRPGRAAAVAVEPGH